MYTFPYNAFNCLEALNRGLPDYDAFKEADGYYLRLDWNEFFF